MAHFSHVRKTMHDAQLIGQWRFTESVIQGSKVTEAKAQDQWHISQVKMAPSRRPVAHLQSPMKHSQRPMTHSPRSMTHFPMANDVLAKVNDVLVSGYRPPTYYSEANDVLPNFQKLLIHSNELNDALHNCQWNIPIRSIAHSPRASDTSSPPSKLRSDLSCVQW